MGADTFTAAILQPAGVPQTAPDRDGTFIQPGSRSGTRTTPIIPPLSVPDPRLPRVPQLRERGDALRGARWGPRGLGWASRFSWLITVVPASPGERDGPFGRDRVSVESPDRTPVTPGWQKRLTYVTTTRQATTGNRGMSVGTIIIAERLQGAIARCPRCDAAAATLWRRFDYFGTELPLYFTKCRRCHRRRSIDADEAAFRLLEAGVAEPMSVLHRGMAAPDESENPSNGEDLEHSVAEAKQLVENRQRAYGKKHPLTFAARAQLAESFGKSGNPQEAVRVYGQLLSDQLAAVGHQSPSVLANQYQAAVWTAHAGNPSEALTALVGILADQERVLGKDHANTLITRTTIAELLYQTGDRERAVEMLQELSRDQLRVLGSEHPVTERTQRLLAEWDRP